MPAELPYVAGVPASGRGPLVLVTGPARSGKSRFAASLAARAPGPVTVLATGLPTDPEMAARIAAHRAERPPSWRTVEEPHDALAALERLGKEPGTVILECLGFLLANWLCPDHAGASSGAAPAGPAADHLGGTPGGAAAGGAQDEGELLGRVRALAAAARDCAARVIVVSNEVGWGVVPAYAAGRRFRDLLGRANQVVAAAADEVWLVVAGLALELKASGLAVPVPPPGRGAAASAPGGDLGEGRP